MLKSQSTEPVTNSQYDHTQQQTLVIKYGGNAMSNPKLQQDIIAEICKLKESGIRVILVHGGGPFINAHLDRLSMKSHFVQGQRYTTAETIAEIQMVLKGQVNSDLVRLFNQNNTKAVGLSGKDGASVSAKILMVDDGGEMVSIGHVGEITTVDTTLINVLLDSGFLPVMAPIAIGPDGQDLNINADVFAGHLAGALKADELIVLTDIDGLRRDINDPKSLINVLKVLEIKDLLGDVIKGGMIPKVESCRTAVQLGAGRARIINGKKPELLRQVLLERETFGTIITL